MSFRKFGKKGFISETKVADFVKHLNDGKIMATKCNRCGKLYFPPRADCPYDMSTDVTWHQLSGRCSLLTYTTAYFAPTGFQDEVPYTIALAECEEGVKVYALLSKDIGEKEIKIGMKLLVTPLPLPNDRITYELKKA
ncbi:MAG: Zn-ribbon domain-containing OB-fold protein [Candidatus Bathyarchaeota archaeon]|nr:MAG: Zn-ribbon domain-containing OB-fold protein [Candidatus Bathyarchaeota archaeon]